MKRVVKVKDIKECNSVKENLEFWLSRSPEERVATVDYLRRQYHGDTARLQRVVKVIQRP